MACYCVQKVGFDTNSAGNGCYETPARPVIHDEAMHLFR